MPGEHKARGKGNEGDGETRREMQRQSCKNRPRNGTQRSEDEKGETAAERQDVAEERREVAAGDGSRDADREKGHLGD